MSDTPLFQNQDEQERIYAPHQVPDEARVEADEAGGMIERNADRTTSDRDAPVPVGSSGTIGAAPVSENFEPGMVREEDDLRRGDTDVVGPHPHDLNEPRERARE